MCGLHTKRKCVYISYSWKTGGSLWFFFKTILIIETMYCKQFLENKNVWDWLVEKSSLSLTVNNVIRQYLMNPEPLLYRNQIVDKHLFSQHQGKNPKTLIYECTMLHPPLLSQQGHAVGKWCNREWDMCVSACQLFYPCLFCNSRVNITICTDTHTNAERHNWHSMLPDMRMLKVNIPSCCSH